MAKLFAQDAAGYDKFGTSVAIWGDTLVVGAPEDNNCCANAGSAHVFQRVRGGWELTATLIPFPGNGHGHFGQSVAIWRDTIVVGMPGEAEEGPNSGSASVFERDQGGSEHWGLVTKLFASDASANDEFGGSVALWEDTVVVGARVADGAALFSGAAYVFERNHGGSGAWGEIQRLTAADGSLNDAFGIGVAIEQDTLFVCAGRDRSPGGITGSAYVFGRHHGGTGDWGLITKILPFNPSTSHLYGWSISLSGDFVLIGDPWANGSNIGGAFLFERNSGGVDAWGPVTELQPPVVHHGAWFGTGVSIAGTTAVVGSRHHVDPAGIPTGSACVFERDAGGPGAWGLARCLTPSDAPPIGQFGAAVAIDSGRLVIGARQDDDEAPQAGSAYVVVLDGPGTAYCSGDGSATACPCANAGISGNGCANSSFSSGSRLCAFGDASVGDDSLVLRSTSSTRYRIGIYFQSLDAVNAGAGEMFGDGLLCVGTPSVRIERAPPNPNGMADTTVPLSQAGGVQAGDSVHYQFWYRDSATSPCGTGFNTSNALVVTWSP